MQPRHVNPNPTPTAFTCAADEMRKPVSVAVMSLLLVSTWALLHHYVGLMLDGELYAFQALARLHPALRVDVYLAATSQDEYTLFSPLYALAIRFLGLRDAATVLFTICTTAFVASAWWVARCLWDETRAWLAAAMSIIVASNYGAFDVFHYSEAFLTARSMAEAMVIAALACHLRGLIRLSWILALASMLIHPLMALPGILFLVCLSVPPLYCSVGAVIGIVATFGVALLAVENAHAAHFLPIIGGGWLEVVRERSQFLFLQYWPLSDWDMHARAVVCLGLGAWAAEDLRVRRVCIVATLIGVTGLLVGLIASTIGPVAVLLQGQAWRWFWVTAFLSVLVLLPTAVRLWQEGGCGSVCATLLIASWTFPPINGTYLAIAALLLWGVRTHVQPRNQKLLRSLAFAMIACMLAWTVANIWSLCTSPPVERTAEPLLIERLRSIYALQIPALVVVGLLVHWVRSGLHVYGRAVIIALIALCVFSLPGSFKHTSSIGTAAEIETLAPWRKAIPATSNVLTVPAAKSAAFIWFSLQRPSYLTVAQSSGVVFSPVTAQEIRRRSEVLLPISDPDWKLMSAIARGKKDRAKNKEEQTRPLTAERLTAICGDSQLGFVIAKEAVGFSPIRADGPGAWKGWNLYDCIQVRQKASSE